MLSTESSPSPEVRIGAMVGGWLRDMVGLCTTGLSVAVVAVVVEKGEGKECPLCRPGDGLPSGPYIRLMQDPPPYSASRETTCLSIGGLSNHLPFPSRVPEHLKQFAASRCVSKIHHKSIAGEMTKESSKGFGRSETRGWPPARHALDTPPNPRLQKRREQRYDSARQLDILSNLNLGPSDDEDDDNHESPEIIHEGISQFVSLLSSEAASLPNPPGQQQPGERSDHQKNDVQKTSSQLPATRGKKKKTKRKQKPQSPLTVAEPPESSTTSRSSGRKRNQWADRCMYAELLELNPGPALNPQIDVGDGLPDDLDTGAWIAISGVPVGKRCLAVTYASSGIAGNGTNFPHHLDCRCDI